MLFTVFFGVFHCLLKIVLSMSNIWITLSDDSACILLYSQLFNWDVKYLDPVVTWDKTDGKMFQGFNTHAPAQCCIYARGRSEEKFKLNYLQWKAFLEKTARPIPTAIEKLMLKLQYLHRFYWLCYESNTSHAEEYLPPVSLKIHNSTIRTNLI